MAFAHHLSRVPRFEEPEDTDTKMYIRENDAESLLMRIGLKWPCARLDHITISSESIQTRFRGGTDNSTNWDDYENFLVIELNKDNGSSDYPDVLGDAIRRVLVSEQEKGQWTSNNE